MTEVLIFEQVLPDEGLVPLGAEAHAEVVLAKRLFKLISLRELPARRD